MSAVEFLCRGCVPWGCLTCTVYLLDLTGWGREADTGGRKTPDGGATAVWY